VDKEEKSTEEVGSRDSFTAPPELEEDGGAYLIGREKCTARRDDCPENR
jgi:hypothetical protein